jgi:6-phosphogluconolactonase
MQTTRRRFLAASATFPFALRILAQPPREFSHVLLGTDTGAGISRATWNAHTGKVGAPELAIASEHPNFFAMHPHLPVLYSTNEIAGPGAAISAYRVDERVASLTLLNKISSQAAGPCFVSVDRTGRMAFAADYGGGAFAAFRLGPQGELVSVAGTLACDHDEECGHLGPRKDRQDAAHMHCATVSPHNDFVLACNLGEDAIEVFPIHAAEQRIGKPMRVECRAGSGPRHVAFHPNGRWVYVVHELDCTIDIYDWSVRKGKPEMTLRPGSVLCTLALPTPVAGNTGCEILVSPAGRFVYTCTRGVDQVIVYSADLASGMLTELQRLPSGGRMPRMIAFDPSRKWLLCCNQGSSNVTVFAHDPATAQLTATGQQIAADTPMCVQFV